MKSQIKFSKEEMQVIEIALISMHDSIKFLKGFSQKKSELELEIERIIEKILVKKYGKTLEKK